MQRTLSKRARRLRAIGQGGFVPANVRSRQIYTLLFGICIAVAVINYAISAVAVSYSPVQSFLLIYAPTWATAIVALLFFTIITLWFQAAKVKAGIYPEYPLVNQEKWRHLKAFVLQDVNEEGEEKAKVVIFELNRGGGLITNVFEGNGPAIVAPILQHNLEEVLTGEYNETHQIGDIPEDEVPRLSAGIRMGATYAIPADFRVYPLGSPLSREDGGKRADLPDYTDARWRLPDPIREWIVSMYRTGGWTDMNDDAVVLFAYDTVKSWEDVEKYTQTPQRTNHDWVVADLQRRIAEMRRDNQNLREDNADNRMADQKGRATVVTTENLYGGQ